MCPSPAVVNVIFQYRSWWLAHDLEERRLLVEIVVGSALAVNHDQVLALQAQLKEMSAHLEGLEEERLPKVRFFLPRMWSGYCSFAYSSHLFFSQLCDIGIFIAAAMATMTQQRHRHSRLLSERVGLTRTPAMSPLPLVAIDQVNQVLTPTPLLSMLTTSPR